ncbi:MAG: glycosyltransferase family 4 protein [Chloroflexi bacterium]|nr:glycosyltransferase family 4 protein [Chloroflexota bacterium]
MLAGKGHAVTFLGWDRGRGAPSVEEVGGVKVREVRCRIRAPLGGGVFFFYPLWWLFVLAWLLRNRWDIVHAENLDCLPPAVLAARLKRKPVIYEILDTYEDSLRLPRLVRNILVIFDKLLIRLVSGVILADDAQKEELGGIPNKRVVTIYDSPADGIPSGARQANGALTLFYGGVLTREKALNLDRLFAALDGIDGVTLAIAGWGNLTGEVEAWSRRKPRQVRFLGAIGHQEVLRRSAEADLLFVLRGAVLPVNRYICGSKLFEAMMCGTPLLVNQGTSTAIKVSEAGCGIVVDARDITAVRAALVRLRDDRGLRERMGRNARRAYEEQYSWSLMQQRLLDLYEQVGGG